MKGFLYLIEIAVAAILVTVILGSFFAAQAVTTDWNRADLISVGNNIFDALGTDAVKLLNETNVMDRAETLKPSNIKYSMKFSGIPKEEINIGTNDPGYLNTFINENHQSNLAYLNNRFIRFNAHGFSSGDSLDDFDILVLHGYPDYTDQRLAEFAKDKAVIGIEDESASVAFKTFYGLAGGSKSGTIGFVDYSDIAKYFFGIGYMIETPNTESGTNNRYGYWSMGGETLRVEISSSKVCINSGDCDPSVSERGIITYDGIDYLAKKIDYNNFKVYLGTKETAFNFVNDLSDGSLKNDVGTENIVGNNYYSIMTRNEKKIWISQFPARSEYYTLVKAVIAASVTDWYRTEPGQAETVEVSRFVPLCCDIPEVAEMTFVLWYVF